MRGVTVELPAAAAAKLTELTLARDSAMDGMRSAASRAGSLPPSAEHLRAGLAAQRDKHAERHRVLSMLVSRLNQFHAELRLAPGFMLEVMPVEVIKLKPHETVVAAITQFRKDILKTIQEIASVRSAPLKRESQEQAITEYIAAQVGRVKPRIAFDVKGRARVMWAEDMIASKDDLVGMLCWILGGASKQVSAAFLRDLDQQPEPANALTVAEREQRLAELSAELLRMERLEESLIVRAASDGTEVLRRPDASPLAVLGIVIVSAQEMAASAA
jgi:hypothetical protein